MAEPALSRRSNVGRSRTAVVAGVTGLVVDAVYLGIIFEQGGSNVDRVNAVSVFVAVFSLLAIVSGIGSDMPTRTRLVVLGASVGGLVTAGVLGIFSVGLPLLVAGVFCGVAWASMRSATRPTPTGSTALAVLAAIGGGGSLALGILLT